LVGTPIVKQARLRQFGTLFVRDSILAWRNGHVVVTLALMVLMILLVILLPAEIKATPGEVILDGTDGQLILAAARTAGLSMTAFTADRDDWDRRLADNTGMIGVLVQGGHAAVEVEISAGAHIPATNLALLRASIDGLVRMATLTGSVDESQPVRSKQSGAVDTAGSGRFPVSYLEAEAAHIPLNLGGVPVFLIFEAGILGFLLVAVFVFQEKQEGTVRAYRAGPAGSLPYIAAKLAVFVLLSLLYGAGVLGGAVVMGARPDIPATLLVLVAYSAFMTLFGLGFASFFRNLSHWFFPGLAILLLNIIPAFAYARPAFNPDWVKVLPAYDAIFMMRDTLFNPGVGLAMPALLRMAGWLVLSCVFCVMAVRFKLLKE
jgi:ABC-2 type transport system permease protein/fluoroquinolone transport system permease protein